MQRIALTASLAALLLTGCAARQTRTDLGPLPAPLLGTRLPPPVAARPPERAPTAPPPAPRTATVSASDVRVPGGIARGRWQAIVVHHSGSPRSTPQGMDSWHRQRGWAGLGYHFVIGNGVGYPDGALFVGPRWRAQGTGAHCKTTAGRYFGQWHKSNFYNEQGIGICLIGDLDAQRPTARQLQTLQDLICVLVAETGVSPARIYGHGEITHKTACPGRHVNMSGLRRAVLAALARPEPTASLDPRSRTGF